jgi:hypothetical protein
MKTGSMPLYWPQSWNESITVMASGITSTPTNSISAGAVSAHAARASRVSDAGAVFAGAVSTAALMRRLRRHAGSCLPAARRGRTASPSAGCGWPSFWRITIAAPHSLSH